MDLTRRFFIQAGTAVIAAACWPRRGAASSGGAARGSASPDSGELPASALGDELQPGDPAHLSEVLEQRPNFACTRRREWVVATDCPLAATEPTLDLLESTAAQVERVARVLGIPTRQSSTRHVAMLFARVEDYRSFAREHDDFNEPDAVGHYAAHAKRAMLTAASASPALRAAMALLGDDASMDRPRFPAARRAVSPQLRASVDQAIDDARRQWMCVASHEAAHQVLCERQVHPPGGACPAWLGEGLACCFETERLVGGSGPDFDVPARRERLQQSLAADALLPLGALISSHGRPALGARGGLDWYAQCWGLVAWLYRERPQQLSAYIDAIWEGRGGASAAERLGAFERIVGPLTALEPAWRADWQPRADDRPHGMPARLQAARTST